MSHYICTGSCQGLAEEENICLNENCDRQYELMQTCDCENGKHGQGIVMKDSDGTVLQNGDDVYLIKDLTAKGTSLTYKRGTVAKNIRITDNPEEIDCKIEGTALSLRVEFLKKKKD